MAYIGKSPINVSNGGTGTVTNTLNAVLLGSGSSAISSVGPANTGQLLTGVTGSAPIFSTTCSGSFSFTSASIGAVRSLAVSHTDTTSTGSSAQFSATVGGPNGGNPLMQYIVPTATTWTHGINNATTSPEADPYVFSSSSSLGTSDVMIIQGTGLINQPSQSCFLAYLASTVSDVTGNGATYTLGTTGATALTEIFDQHNDFNTNGTYTCPITSRVDLRCSMTVTGTTSATSFTLSIVTSNRTYQNIFTRSALAANQTIYLSVIADMDISDTATCTLVVTGEAGNTDDILGGSTIGTYFCGAIVA